MAVYRPTRVQTSLQTSGETPWKASRESGRDPSLGRAEETSFQLPSDRCWI